MSEKVAIVTGGGRGIGRAICEGLATAGMQVVALARSRQELDETAAIIEKAGGTCRGEPVDVRDGVALDALIARVATELGRVDVLVNNAGVAPLASIEETDPAMFDETMGVNVGAVYRACRAVWPLMRKQGAGVIVSISSAASVDPFPGFALYGASKAWINMWTKALGAEGEPVGIRVFAAAPGAVETRMLRTAFPDFPNDEVLAPSDVAEVVVSLTRSDCPHASGDTVFIKK